MLAVVFLVVLVLSCLFGVFQLGTFHAGTQIHHVDTPMCQEMLEDLKLLIAQLKAELNARNVAELKGQSESNASTDVSTSRPSDALTSKPSHAPTSPKSQPQCTTYVRPKAKLQCSCISCGHTEHDLRIEEEKGVCGILLSGKCDSTAATRNQPGCYTEPQFAGCHCAALQPGYIRASDRKRGLQTCGHYERIYDPIHAEQQCECRGETVYSMAAPLKETTFSNTEIKINHGRLTALQVSRRTLLSTMVTWLEKHRIRYLVVKGILLGYLRAKNFIPWDDDLDIRIHEDDWLDLKKIYNEATLIQTPSEESYKESYMTGPLMWDKRLREVAERHVVPDLGQVQPGIQVTAPGVGLDIEFPGAIHLDIVIASYQHPHGCDASLPFDCTWRPEQWLWDEPTRKINIAGIEVQAPSERLTHKILTTMYGKDYMNAPNVDLVCFDPEDRVLIRYSADGEHLEVARNAATECAV